MTGQSLIIYHISDLHFVANLFERGGTNRSKTWGAKSHSVARASMLADTLAVLPSRSSILVVTGDVSTDGSHGALTSVSRFLESSSVPDPNRSYPLSCLAWPLERRLVTPGNHDRYGGRRLALQTTSREFERVFAVNDPYPIVRLHLPSQPEDIAIAFFVVDSVPTVDLQQATGRLRFTRLVAAGLVPESACAQLVRAAHDLDTSSRGLDLEGRPAELGDRKLLRVVLLHHHPVNDPAARPPRVVDKVKNRIFPDTLSEADRFLDACMQAGIDMVLFGHKHKRYPVKLEVPNGHRRVVAVARDNIHFLCAPSATQYKTSHPAGFYQIAITSNEILATAFEQLPKSSLFEPVDNLATIEW